MEKVQAQRPEITDRPPPKKDIPQTLKKKSEGGVTVKPTKETFLETRLSRLEEQLAIAQSRVEALEEARTD